MTGGNRLPLRSAARRRLSGRSVIFLVTTQTAVIREGVANGLTDPKRPFSKRGAPKLFAAENDSVG
jgi:hypothetical protein